MAYLKPQSPLRQGIDHIYPITTHDQIIMPDGSRWDGTQEGVYYGSDTPPDNIKIWLDPTGVSADQTVFSPIEKTDNMTQSVGLGDDGKLYTLDFYSTIVDGAAAHNGIYRGKNIQDKYENGTLWTVIQDGTFKDLFIGDYFDITISTSFTASETIRCVLAGFDCQYNRGDTALTTHHAVIVPYNCFTATAQMNSSNVTTGAYVGSAMYTSVLPVYQTALESVFGSHLLTNRELLANSVNTSAASSAGAGWTGSSNNWAWYDCKLRLMSEVEVYGATVFSSSGYDTGNANQRLPYFTLNPGRLVCSLGSTSSVSRAYWWLSSVSSSILFAAVSRDGHASCYGASNPLGVRPRWLIG